MSPEKKFELGDYVEVKDRIKLFYELFGQGRLVTADVTFPEVGDGKPRVMVKAYAYRTPDDPHPGVGYSWLEVPGATPYTRGSEIENAETSAWGRAIGSLGILIDRSIASSNEIQNKAGQDEATDSRPSRTDSEGLIGIAKVGKNQDGELRQAADIGWVMPFRVSEGATSYIVHAEGELAEALAQIKDRVIGERVTVWGRWSDETIPAKGSKPEIHYRILHLERIQTPDGTLPMVNEPPDTIPLFGEDDAA